MKNRRRRNNQKHTLFIEQKLNFLQKISKLLYSPGDYKKTLSHIAKTAVPWLADWCAIDILEDSEIKRLAIAHTNPQKIKIAKALTRRYPINLQEGGIAEVIKTGKPLIYRDISDELLKKTAKDDEHLRLLQEIGIKAVVILPLANRDKVFGTVTLVNSTVERKFTREVITLAKELAQQASLAVDNAILQQNLQFELKERKRAEEELRILAHASNIFTSSLDYKTILQELARLSVPLLADYCVIDMVRENERIYRLAMYHADEKQAKWFEQLRQFSPSIKKNHPIMVVFKQGKPTLSKKVTEKTLQRVATSPLHLKILKKLHPTSCIWVPLAIRGKILGVMTFVTTHNHRSYTKSDLSLVQDLAHRAALAVENARLYHSMQIELSERKISERALKESEERFRLLVENSYDYAIFMIDTKGKIVSWNQGAENMINLSAEEVKDRHISEIFLDKDQGVEVITKLQRSRKTDKYQEEVLLQRKKRFRFWADLTISALHNEEGLLKGYSVIIKDITARKEAQSRINFQANILSQVNEGIVVVDMQGRIIYWNFGAELLYDYQANEAIGKKLKEVLKYDFVEIERKEAFEKSLKELGFWHGEEVHYKKNGERMFVEVSVSILRNEDNVETGVLSIIHDITERKLLDQRKDEFLSIASHELKTPVTSIKAFTQILQKKLTEQNDQQSVYFLNKMIEQLNRLTLLISDLLDITRLQEGKLMFRKEQFNIGRFVQSSVEDLQYSSPKHKLILNNIVEQQIYADRDRIGQVLINLILNAIKYSPDADKVIIDMKQVEDGVEICIEDFGIGISKDDQTKVFERFFRAGGEVTQTFPGLGLGLYISSEIIKRHNGRMWLESEKGRGSKFFVFLPEGKPIND